MKRIYLLLIYVLGCGILAAQSCLPDGITFTTQEEVDSFAVNYPDCTDILGYLVISDHQVPSESKINNLGGLNSLLSVQGNLTIGGSYSHQGTDKLINLNGLENLLFIGGDLFIINNDSLEGMSGLENLSSIGGDLFIGNNDSLKGMSDLNNLSSIGMSLIIRNNPVLSDLTGLESLAFVGEDLQISSNNSLLNFEGLEQLSSISGNLLITNNSALVNMEGFNNLSTIARDFRLAENALENFIGMDSLKSIGRSFTVKFNYNLINFNGLNNLDTIGSYFSVGHRYDTDYKNALVNFTGLENLNYIGNEFEVRRNPYLESFLGLENLSSVNGLIIIQNYNLSYCNIPFVCNYIENNNNYVIGFNSTGCNSAVEVGSSCPTSSCPPVGIMLDTQEKIDSFSINYPNCTAIGKIIIKGINETEITNLNGLNQLISAESIHIENNHALVSLIGLDSIGTEINELQIFNNPNLSTCNVLSICNYLGNGGLSTINNNATDCNSALEILYICTDVTPGTSEGFIFSTQQQIDSFPILYPDYDSIQGNVIIQGENLTSINNLYGLSQISYIGGILIIKDNTNLVSLTGLESLTAAEGGLVIDNNDSLGWLYELANLISVRGELIISNNAGLTELDGIHNISGSDIAYLQITRNPALSGCSVNSTCNYFFGDEIGSLYRKDATIYGNVGGNYIVGPICGSPHELRANCPQYLPIELTHFQAQIQQKTALLIWQTATETHNKGFEIQRSKDGTTWQKIGWQDGQGDTQTPHDYTHRDENPLFGTSYYRLKQIDFDGTSSHSDIVKVDYAGTGISIYPNPVKNTLIIADLDGNNIRHIAIYDQIGRQVISQNSIQNTIDVSALASGVYIIKIDIDKGIFCKKFIVEK